MLIGSISCRGQTKLEYSPPFGGVPRGDRSAVAFDDRAHDRETEAAAGRYGGAGARGVHLVKPIEDPRQVLVGNSGAGVADTDQHGLPVGGRRQADATS